MSDICTVAHVPDELDQAWLQHLRDFDVAHPGCHFEVIADMPQRSMAEALELLRLNPELPVTQVFRHENPPVR